jgi:high-affinity iron transporter
MITSFFLALREGMEAALIVGITLGAARKLHRDDLARPIWLGVALAGGLSLAAGATLGWLGTGLEGPAQEAFEAITTLLAAAVLTWMVFWMQSQGRAVEIDLKAGVQRAAASGQRTAVFWLAFFAVLREGLETALFLTAAALASGVSSTVVGGLLGLATAIGLAWALFTATLRLDVRRFFSLTSPLVLFLAAGLVAHGVHEFIELGWIPGLIDPVWNVNPFLNEGSIVGQLLRALFGYNGDPSLTEILAYLAYLGGVAAVLARRRAVVPAGQRA